MKTLHELCVIATNKMISDNVTKHISYISPEDDITFGLKEGGKIPKVTIEFVEESESYPRHGSPGYETFINGHGAISQIQSVQ